MDLLPFLETATQHANLLYDGCTVSRGRLSLVLSCAAAGGAAGALWCFDRACAEFAFSCSYVLQGGTGPALLGEGAVENDRLSVLELSEEGGQPLVELVGWDPFGALDMATDVVCVLVSLFVSYLLPVVLDRVGRGPQKKGVPPSRTSMIATELSGVFEASSCSDKAATSTRGRFAMVNLDMARLNMVLMGKMVVCSGRSCCSNWVPGGVPRGVDGLSGTRPWRGKCSGPAPPLLLGTLHGTCIDILTTTELLR